MVMTGGSVFVSPPTLNAGVKSDDVNVMVAMSSSASQMLTKLASISGTVKV
jgi:hypothetical protein